LPPVVLLLTVLELSSDAGASLSNEEKKIILDGHNKYRSQVSPPAMDMLKMWQEEEDGCLSQRAVPACLEQTSQQSSRLNSTFVGWGETLLMDPAPCQGRALPNGVSAPALSLGCGHALSLPQVVWASTHQIGCGAKFCEKIDGIETEGMYLLVCNYYPPGNMKGRKPYREGPSCSQCPESRICVNSLCEAEVDTGEPLSPLTTEAPALLES
ncbi:PI16 inhibitor, partial [Probosciger aterrimus]|nr:PI16 inhibitor [Probosciger aterrimus]